MKENEVGAYVGLSGAAGLYALALSTEQGRQFTERHTWATVVIGNSLILAALRAVLPAEQWRRVALAFVAAGTPMILRSLLRR